MTLSEWRDRLALMSVSSIVHFEPHEAADLARAIDDAAARKANRLTATEWRWLGLCTHCAAHLSGVFVDVEGDEALPPRPTPNERGSK